MSARVLVVDDLLPNVKLLEAKLTAEFFNVATAFGGAEALDLCRAEPPDIVLLDVMMPGMDGYEVCRRLKADPKTRHIPVVMVTALSDTQDRVRGLEAGADDFLTKPVNDMALQARIRSLVRLKMMMDEWRLRQETGERFGIVADKSVSDNEYRNGKILVVDDSPVSDQRICQALATDDHEVTVVRASDEASTQSRERACDLIIVSLIRSGREGLRLCAQLRSAEVTRHVPILVLVDSGDYERLAKALDLGVSDYLITPFDRNEVIARTRTQIRRRRYQERLRGYYEQNISMAITDSLTGLHNRRFLNTHLDRLLNRARANGKVVAALVLDIDFFKSINDTHGHHVGDDVLRAVANRIAGNLRGEDTVARWGGEEFVVVMPEADSRQAQGVADRLRRKIALEPISISGQSGEVRVTVSVGVALSGGERATSAALLKAADEALYQAKRDGRDCVATAPDPNGETGSDNARDGLTPTIEARVS